MFARVHACACLGEGMIEFSGRPLARRFGGDTLNVALYLARLLRGRPTGMRYLTALGTDPLSDELLASWRAERIETDRVARLPGKQPGLYLIETDARGERRFHYWRGDSAARHYFAGEIDWPALLQDIDWLHLSGITLALFPAARRRQLLEALIVFKQRGGRIGFDDNYRAALWPAHEARAAYRAALPLANMALLTAEDEIAVWGAATAAQMIGRARDLGASEVVLRQGGQTAFARNNDSEATVAPEPVATVVDTTAAGDAFTAAYFAARLRGAMLADALRAGHRLASVVIRHPGAIIPANAMPNEFPVSIPGAANRASTEELR